MSCLFLLEDDLQLGGALLQSLAHAGFEPTWVRRVSDASEALKRGVFAAAILDIQLPDGTGFDVLDTLRRRGDRTPVLILTIQDAIADRVRGLQAGADDYLIKPFAVVELIARIHALIRRSAGQAAADWQIGALRIEPDQHRASLAGKALELSPKEFRLLLELAREAGKVVPRIRLETAVFRSPPAVGSNLLDVHMYNLRRKMGAAADSIRTVHGVGYLLQP